MRTQRLNTWHLSLMKGAILVMENKLRLSIGGMELHKKRSEGFHRIFSCFEKLDVVFLAFLNFAPMVEALRAVRTRPRCRRPR